MVFVICKNCGKTKMHQSQGYCITCYKKLVWKPKTSICQRCKREMVLHAKGYCPGCYNFMFHLEKNRGVTYAKYHNISPELYKKLLKPCVVCGFSEVIDLHHLDENKKNNSEANLISLCPNHHRMIHHTDFKSEIQQALEKKGIVSPKNPVSFY